MTAKLKILCTVSALCLLCSIVFFSGFVTEVVPKASGEEYTEPTDPGNTDPGSYTDPGYTDPGSYTDPGYTDPGSNADPGYTDPGSNTDPGYTEPVYSAPDQSYTQSSYEEPQSTVQEYTPAYSEVISEGNYPQRDTTRRYVDYTSQYIAYTYEAQYDDNYYYVPTYTEPTESLIEVESDTIDTDELTSDDWKSIMLDLEQGGITDGTKTFNFIKNNAENDGSDNSLMWMLYLGMGLITIAIFIIIYVVISTKKANKSFRKYKTA